MTVKFSILATITVLVCNMFIAAPASSQETEQQTLDRSTPKQYDTINFVRLTPNSLPQPTIVAAPDANISYSEFRSLLDENRILKAEIAIFGQWILIETRDNEKFRMAAPNGHNLQDRLVDAGAEVSFVGNPPFNPDFKPPSSLELLWYAVAEVLPWAIAFFAVLFVIMRAGAAERRQRFQQLVELEKSRTDEFFERLEKALTEQQSKNG